MTSIRTTTPTSDRMGLATRRIILSAVWPCLARIPLPKASANAEAELCVSVTLEGVHDALRGTVRVTAVDTSVTGSGSVRTLMERPIHGMLMVLPQWRALELRCEGGPSIEALLPAAPIHESFVGRHEGSVGTTSGTGSGFETPRAYLHTNLMPTLGFLGGRYGAPRVEISEV